MSQISNLNFHNFLVKGNNASCCFADDGKCNGFRVYWRKRTADNRKRVNSDRGESSESERDSKEELRKAGIEDWIAYLDGLDPKVEIESMNSGANDIKVLISLQEIPPFTKFQKISRCPHRFRKSHQF